MIKRALATALLAATATAAAIGVERMTLQACLEQALANNFALRITRNDAQMASNAATRANAGALPSIDMTAGYSAAFDYSRSTGHGIAAKSLAGAFNQWAGAGVSVSYTIFDGFLTQANYSRLKALEELSATSTRMELEDLMADVATAYYWLVRMQRREGSRTRNVQLSQERLRLARELYESGVGTKAEMLQAEVDLNADSSVLVAQQQSVISAGIRLRQLMADADPSAPIVTADPVIEQFNYIFDAPVLHTSMLACNAELMEAVQRRGIAAIEYKQVTARDYPYLKANAAFAYDWTRSTKPEVRTNQGWGPEVGVTLGYNIFDGTRRTARRNARLAIENAELRREQAEQTLEARFADMWSDYLNKLRLLAIEQNSMAAADANYAEAIAMYAEGKLAGVDLRRAQEGMIDAGGRVTVATYDLKLAEISLLQLSGLIADALLPQK